MESVNCYSSIDPLFKLDTCHPALIFEIDKFYLPDKLYYKYKMFNFDRADYVGLSTALGNMNWSCIYDSSDSLEDKLAKFYDILYEKIAC